MSRTARPGHRSATTTPSPPSSFPRSSRAARPQRLRSVRWLTARAGLAWSAGAVLLATCLVLTLGLQRDAASARRAYGETRPVWLARHDLAAGSVLTEDDLEQRQLPRLLVPPSALDAGDPAGSPFGRVTREALADGEILLGHRLAGPATGGPAALLPPGTVGLALGSRSPLPGVGVSDRVALILLGSSTPGGDPMPLSTGRATSVPAATSAAVTVPARVVSAGPAQDGLVVAVDAADAGAVAAAVRRDEVVIALLSPGDTGPVPAGGPRGGAGR